MKIYSPTELKYSRQHRLVVVVGVGVGVCVCVCEKRSECVYRLVIICGETVLYIHWQHLYFNIIDSS